MNEIAVINLVLSVIVLGLGIWAFQRRKSAAGLLLGIAFGFFAVSHLLNILGLSVSLEIPLIIIRIFGYLSAILAAYRIAMAA